MRCVRSIHPFTTVHSLRLTHSPTYPHSPARTQFVLFGNNEYLRFMHGTSRFDCKAADVPACNIYANVGNWTHFAFTWTNYGDQDGGLGANTMLYIDGEPVRAGRPITGRLQGP